MSNVMNENEYVGFAIRRPNEEGAIVYVFDILDEGVKMYGGYRMLGETEKHTNFDDASILSLTLTDGTLPITVEDFDDRVQNGETNDASNCTIFIKASILGRVEFKDKKAREGIDTGDSSAFRAMFYQCMKCLEKVEEEEKAERLKKSAKKKGRKAATKKQKKKA